MITIDEVELLGSAEMFDNRSTMGTLRKLEEDGLKDAHGRSLSQKNMGRVNGGAARGYSENVWENPVMSKSCADLPVIDEYRGQRRPSRQKKNKHSDVSLKRWGHRDQDSNGNARIEEQEFEIQKWEEERHQNNKNASLRNSHYSNSQHSSKNVARDQFYRADEQKSYMTDKNSNLMENSTSQNNFYVYKQQTPTMENAYLARDRKLTGI
jgi:hypothetical protein